MKFVIVLQAYDEMLRVCLINSDQLGAYVGGKIAVIVQKYIT